VIIKLVNVHLDVLVERHNNDDHAPNGWKAHVYHNAIRNGWKCVVYVAKDNHIKVKKLVTLRENTIK
jgi:hypothetical protein